MQGWSPDFIPKLTKDVVDLKLVDDTVPINGDNVLLLTKELAQQEGIFAGISGGATLAGGLRIAQTAPPGTTILCMLPDTGERYLSTPLFDDIPIEMMEEEIEISRSTPNYRFDSPTCSVSPQAAAGPDDVTPEARAFVADAVADRKQPVVMFALEWCEFCWSVRKLFADRKVPFRDITLDSVDYQEGNRGGQIRAALGERTSIRTIPQVFVGEEFVGGCTETFDAWKEGRLQRLMKQHGVAFEEKAGLDPYSFLPSWLHPR
jgi:cysteine synthase A